MHWVTAEMQMHLKYYVNLSLDYICNKCMKYECIFTYSYVPSPYILVYIHVYVYMLVLINLK